jgi:4-azaleucine resistance transporter AzlC
MSYARSQPPPAARRSGLREGLRAAAPVGIAVFFVGVSFGVVARPLIGGAAAIVMSMVVFAGSAQFAAAAVLADGGGAAAAIAAGVLLNARFVPMGIAVASSLRGGRLRRAVEGQAVVDASWALANRGEGRFDRDVLLGATLAQYPAWLLGTALGVVAGDRLGDPHAFGLDAIFPAFFLILLIEELRSPRARTAAMLAAAVALLLLPVAPPGVPVLAAALVALLGLRKR